MCMRAYDVYRGNGRAHAIAVKNNVPYLGESRRTPLKRVPYSTKPKQLVQGFIRPRRADFYRQETEFYRFRTEFYSGG